MSHYVLDLSRLISSSGRPAPTGIDRVELAYAREMLTWPENQVSFAAMTGWLEFGFVHRRTAENFIAALAAHWYSGVAPRKAGRIASRITASIRLRGERSLHARLKRQSPPIVYLNVSHHHLDRPATILRLKKRHGALFVPLVHDLIPIEYPEYARPNQDETHNRRIATVSHLADAIIVVSQTTANLLAPNLEAANRAPPVLVGHLGLDLPHETTQAPFEIPTPYFICIGTIEPRKNHLLLLKLWRKMALERGAETPHLVIVGRRGWENENVVDMLERCLALRGKVHEFSSVTDSQVCGLIQGARALLMPSFSEGFGLPIIEALALGTPVLCSDIPAFLEVGGSIPEFLDPLDGPSWHRAIHDYAQPQSSRRAAQLARLQGWPKPDWKHHFAEVNAMLSRLVAG